MENPFRYGDVATGVYFTDRLVELSELDADVRAGQNVVIISPRRYGKTSLIVQAMERLRQQDVLVAYLDLFRTPTKDRLADHLADAIYGGLVAPLERVWQRASTLFQKLPLQPKVTINPDGTPSFEFAAAEHSRDVDRTLEALLALPAEIAKHRRRRVAVILDEFQEVMTIDPNLPAIMRSLFQFQGDVAHIFLGSKQHLMQEVFNDENQPLYKLAKPMVLRPIGREEFTRFIQERFAATQQRIADDAIARILDVTAGHPHDTQELCYFTWSLAEVEDAPATSELVERALSRVLEAEDAHYTTVWEQLSAHQRLVLIVLATDPGMVYAESYRRQHRLGTPSSVQRSLQRLMARELVQFAPPAAYTVPDTFLRAWVGRIAGTFGRRR